MPFIADNVQRALDSYKPVSVGSAGDLGRRLDQMAEIAAKAMQLDQVPRASDSARKAET